MIKTVSLETAKLLKEAGFRQDTYFKWKTWIPNEYSGSMDRKLDHNPLIANEEDRKNIFSAPTTDELLEELPHLTEKNGRKYRLHIGKGNSFWDVRYYQDREYGNPIHFISGNPGVSLPDILAQMWLWLKKEGLLNAQAN